VCAKSAAACDHRLATLNYDSQAALLQTQLTALNLDILQLQARVNLILALGGGWEDSGK
jgi:outer membrane protein TolC